MYIVCLGLDMRYLSRYLIRLSKKNSWLNLDLIRISWHKSPIWIACVRADTFVYVMIRSSQTDVTCCDIAWWRWLFFSRLKWKVITISATIRPQRIYLYIPIDHIYILQLNADEIITIGSGGRVWGERFNATRCAK